MDRDHEKSTQPCDTPGSGQKRLCECDQLIDEGTSGLCSVCGGLFIRESTRGRVKLNGKTIGSDNLADAKCPGAIDQYNLLWHWLTTGRHKGEIS